MAYQSKYTGLQIDDILDSVEWKQGKIEDLASIRAGAQKGATALQSYTEKYTGTVTGIKINGVVKSGSGVIDLGTISTDISGKQDKLVDGVNIATINGQSLTVGGDITIKGGSDVEVPTKVSQLENDAEYITHEDVAAVALSGSYNDLQDTPTIPSAVTESTVSGWGFTKNAGTITGVSANGTSVATSGVANIPAASTSAYGVTKLSSSTSSTSTTEAATPSAVKSAYDLANSYKGTVTGVKINGTTKNPSSGIVDLGYINKQLSTTTSSSMTLSPNIYYRNTSTSLSTLTITLGSASNSNVINEYFVEFTTRSAGTTVSLPSTIKCANGETPTFEASTTYQISIVNNLGVVQKFK